MMNLSDEELVSRCKVELPQTTRSYELLVQRYMNRVYAHAYTVVGHKEEAEDIAQEVFVKVYHGLKNFQQRSSFSSWLHRITINSSLDALEKMKRSPGQTSPAKQAGLREEEHERAEWQPVPIQTTNPEEHAIQKELRECINLVFRTLDGEQTKLIVMRDFHDLSYDEIAQTLGAGLSAIKMRIHRARLAFQNIFNQFCGSIYMPLSKAVNYSVRAGAKKEGN